MSSIPNEITRRLRVPGYIVVAYMTVGSLLDVLISAQPTLIHDIRWRLGVATLVTGASGTELLGGLLFVGLAILAWDDIALWVAFALSLLIGLLYLGFSGVFTLDSLQMRGQVRPEMLSRYNLGLVWTLARLVFTGIVFFIIAGACVRAARELRRLVDRTSAKPASTLIVGTQLTPGVNPPAPRPNLERTKTPTA